MEASIHCFMACVGASVCNEYIIFIDLQDPYNPYPHLQAYKPDG